MEDRAGIWEMGAVKDPSSAALLLLWVRERFLLLSSSGTEPKRHQTKGFKIWMLSPLILDLEETGFLVRPNQTKQNTLLLRSKRV